MGGKRRRTGPGASESPERGVRKDGEVKGSASSQALTVHVAFLWFWLQVDVRDAETRALIWAKVKDRWPGAMRGKKSDAPHQFTKLVDWYEIIKGLRNAGDVDTFLEVLHCCVDEATPSKTTTWRPLALPHNVIGIGGRKAGLERIAGVRLYLDAWVRAFFATELVVGPAKDLGLRARHVIKPRSIVAMGFVDAEAPKHPISQTADGIPILGPLALLNAGCGGHAKVSFSKNKDGTTWSAVALGKIHKGSNILALYGNSNDGIPWTCALVNCKRPVAKTLDETCEFHDD
mmetsp:Transcript_32679/g.104198  ORF Transcript_32679/g.104198 Transcript_32679/m.104198 type:complete len:289 (+) Transcript_32679:52-918(+)